MLNISIYFSYFWESILKDIWGSPIWLVFGEAWFCKKSLWGSSGEGLWQMAAISNPTLWSCIFFFVNMVLCNVKNIQIADKFCESQCLWSHYIYRTVTKHTHIQSSKLNLNHLLVHLAYVKPPIQLKILEPQSNLEWGAFL